MRTLIRLALSDHDTTIAAPAARSAALLAVTLVVAAGLPAPSASAQGAVPCTAIESDAERLACYDRALRPARAPAPATAPAQQPRAEPPATAARAAPTARPSAAEDEIVPLVIVDVRALTGRPATFVARDGTAWVQTDSQRLNLPDAPFDAELKRGAMGSYFLVPNNRTRAIRVRPVAER